MWILVRGRDEIIRRPAPRRPNRARHGPPHHLENHRHCRGPVPERRNGQHTRILDHGKTLTQLGQYCVRVYAGISWLYREGRLEKIVPEFDATVDVVASRPANGATVFNAACVEDDIGRLLHYLLCPCERRAEEAERW